MEWLQAIATGHAKLKPGLMQYAPGDQRNMYQALRRTSHTLRTSTVHKMKNLDKKYSFMRHMTPILLATMVDELLDAVANTPPSDSGTISGTDSGAHPGTDSGTLTVVQPTGEEQHTDKDLMLTFANSPRRWTPVPTPAPTPKWMKKVRARTSISIPASYPA